MAGYILGLPWRHQGIDPERYRDHQARLPVDILEFFNEVAALDLFHKTSGGEESVAKAKKQDAMIEKRRGQRTAA